MVAVLPGILISISQASEAVEFGLCSNCSSMKLQALSGWVSGAPGKCCLWEGNDVGLRWPRDGPMRELEARCLVPDSWGECRSQPLRGRTFSTLELFEEVTTFWLWLGIFPVDFQRLSELKFKEKIRGVSFHQAQDLSQNRASKVSVRSCKYLFLAMI